MEYRVISHGSKKIEYNMFILEYEIDLYKETIESDKLNIKNTEIENNKIRKDYSLYILRKNGIQVKISKNHDETINKHDALFKIRLSQMGRYIYLFKFDVTTDNLNLIEKILKKLKGHYIVENSVLQLSSSSIFGAWGKDTFMIALVEPLSNFGFMPLKNYFSSLKCKMEFDKIIEKNKCQELNCQEKILSDHALLLLVKIDEEKYPLLYKAINSNLTKISDIRMNREDKIEQLNVSSLLIKDTFEKIEKCNIEYYFPIYMRRNEKIENKNYRILKVEKSEYPLFEFQIKGKYSNIGPSVKNIFWIKIIKSKTTSNLYEILNYNGYTKLLKDDVSIYTFNENGKISANALISHDFRSRDNLENICKYCQIIQHNLKSKNK